MKIAVIGAGFTGLTASYFLAKAGFEVTLFEKEPHVGGLASGFRLPGWDWALERQYHHMFTSDSCFLELASEIGLSREIFFKRPVTSLFRQGLGVIPFDSPGAFLSASFLSAFEKARLGLVLLLLKSIPNGQFLEKYTAKSWLTMSMGKSVFEKIWWPLLEAKFGSHAESVNMAWFWARIKKRSARLGYVRGGFQVFAEQIAKKIQGANGEIFLKTTVEGARVHGSGWEISTSSEEMRRDYAFDKVLVTSSSGVFTKIFPFLPEVYKKRILSISHLASLNLILLLSEGFMKDTYWLNINERNFPFLAVVEHTNFVDKNYYGGDRILYVGNYLPSDHEFFTLSKEELLERFTPSLRLINKDFSTSWVKDSFLFTGEIAQPVVVQNYSKLMPTFATPLENVFLSNMDMVYPWDRGTNYAIELGKRVAKIIVSGS